MNYLKYLLLPSVVLYSMLASIHTGAQTWNFVGAPRFSAGRAFDASIVIDGNNFPYIAFADGTKGSMVTSIMKFNGRNWMPVGPQKLTGFARWLSFAIDDANTPYVAFIDNDNKVSVNKFDGSNWVLVGNARFSTNYASVLSLAMDRHGTPYVAYIDYEYYGGRKLRVMKLNGNNWESTDSSGLSAKSPWNPLLSIGRNNTPYLAFTDMDTNFRYRARVVKYNGNEWIAVGSIDTLVNAHGISIALDTSETPYIAFTDANDSDKTYVQKFNGINWIQVGNTSAWAYIRSICIDPKNTPYIALADPSKNFRATVLKYTGSNWDIAGNSAFSSWGMFSCSMALDKEGIPYVALIDTPGAYKATVMKLEQGGPASSAVFTTLFPNPNHGSFALNVLALLDEPVTVVITTATGMLVKELVTTTNKKTQIDLNIRNGLYFVTVLTGSNRQTVQMTVF